MDTVTGMLSSGLREKIEQNTGRNTTANNFGYAVEMIGRNLGGGYNNSRLGGNVSQAAGQLLQKFTSNMNTWSTVNY